MRIHIKTSAALDLSYLHEGGFDIVSDDPEIDFGAMQMFVTSIAQCTFAVLATYGERFGASAEDISMGVTWKYAESPHRIGGIEMDIRWPQLPESRLDAATRVAHQCTLHNTLRHSMEIDTMVEN